MMAEQQATREEVRDMARTILENQQKEIEQMEVWRLEWYGSTDVSATPTP
jgi:uncharacterized protein (DUF305 family)